MLGLGSKTTQYYLEQLNLLYNKEHGGYSTCPIKMLNCDFEKINPYLPYNFEKLEPVILQAILELDALGVDNIVIPNITLHHTIDQLKLPNEIAAKIIHPLSVLFSELNSHSIKEVTIIGSEHTMKSGLFRAYFEKQHITTNVPNPNEIQSIDNIRKEIYKGNLNINVINEFNQILHKYGDKNPIIACTELSIANQSSHFDLVNLQIEAALKTFQK